MRIVGMALVGLGIVMPVLAAVGFFGPLLGGGRVTIEGNLICFAIAICGIVALAVGNMIVRRNEEHDVEKFVEGQVSVFGMTPSPSSPWSGDSYMNRVRAFNLTRLNWVGWLVVFAMIGFVFLAGTVVAALIRPDQWGKKRPTATAHPDHCSPIVLFGYWILCSREMALEAVWSLNLPYAGI